MIDEYSKEYYFRLKKKERLILIITFTILLFGLTFFFLSALLINKDNVLTIKIIDGVLLSLILIGCVYTLYEVYLPLRRHNRFLFRLLTVARFQGSFKVEEISKPYILQKGVKVYEITGINDDKKRMAYYLESHFPLTFKVKDKIDVTIANNFIVDYKVKGHGKKDLQ